MKSPWNLTILVLLLAVIQKAPRTNSQHVRRSTRKLSINPTERQAVTNDNFSTSEYIQLSAAGKLQKLWSEIERRNGTRAEFPSGLKRMGLMLGSNAPVYEHRGDAMPTYLGIITRPKYIHTVGPVGKVKFIPTANSAGYMGIFAGADHGLIRLTTPQQPSASVPLDPGISLKFLRDGADSANVVALNSLEGQEGNWDFFALDLSNHLVLPRRAFSVSRLINAKFSMETPFTTAIGLKDWGETDQFGDASPAPKYPYRLLFEPGEDVTDLLPRDFNGTDYMFYVNQLIAQVPADVVLYKVHAIDQPGELGGKEVHIGDIQLDGKLMSSDWADKNLFFRHGKMDLDLKDNQEWVNFIESFSCPFSNLNDAGVPSTP